MNVTGYVCHECGNGLEEIRGRSMLWCRRCSKRRRVPTHPALMSPSRWDEHRAARRRFAP